MKVVVGLGNPGPEYVMTRHNAGVEFVDAMAEMMKGNSTSLQLSPNLGERATSSYGWRRKKDIMVAEFPDMILVKSANVFMNESGRMIRDLQYLNVIPTEQSERRDPLGSNELRDSSAKLGMTSFFIAHDDLDIRLGEYKIQFGKGPKEHGGINSVEEVLGTKEFWRVRIGIDNRPSFAEATEGEKYVLQKFSMEEKEVLDKVVERIMGEIIK